VDKKLNKPVETLLEYRFRGVYLTVVPVGRRLTCRFCFSIFFFFFFFGWVSLVVGALEG